MGREIRRMKRGGKLTPKKNKTIYGSGGEKRGLKTEEGKGMSEKVVLREEAGKRTSAQVRHH